MSHTDQITKDDLDSLPIEVLTQLDRKILLAHGIIPPERPKMIKCAARKEPIEPAVKNKSWNSLIAWMKHRNLKPRDVLKILKAGIK